MLKLDIKKPRKFISPLLSKKSVTADQITQFDEATQSYLAELEKQRIAKQSEPNIVSNALKPYFEKLSYVAQSYSQKGQSGMDLALMLEHSPSVIIEAKVFESTAMITQGDINKKALHEAILYFMREREKKNNTIYHIIITDFYHWFVFDAKDFEKLFWKNSSFQKIFKKYGDDTVLDNGTDFFYDLAKDEIAKMKSKTDLFEEEVLIECAYFDLRDKRTEKQSIALYKLLSKDTLLKDFNPNDANTLNRVFYAELLYILGLEEQSSGGKKLISRAKTPHSASLYENIVRNLKLAGHSQEFETIIRLMIIWINRILFLKLLESQLVKWNDDSKYKFLNSQTIHDFDMMKIFFFDILANRPHDRDHKDFPHIPYLNSSLFEMNEIEKQYIDISSLEDNCTLPYYKKTVLKDGHSNRKDGEVNMLHYLFEFLDAYDFSSEGSEEIVTESKSLINASVLGLIFEKLNGYKDGSFYTPSFITMYMSKETITKAIIEKFNQAKGWSCKTLDELDDKIEDKKEANDIINSLTVCDPAVGSGHFLVSSLNTILEIKSQLRILFDAEGRRIKDYELSVENDELIIKDDEGEIFEYKRGSKEKTRIQKMLFLEKQKIIENSLFGVDINPNSAHITRLRLWIELLKNSYYAEDTHLVTMPNIDINIKVGNSLISRYGLDDEIDIPNIKHAIERYKSSVKEYKEGNFLSTKDDIRTAIDDVKGMFGLTLKAQWKQTEEYKKVLGKYVKEYGMDGLTRNMQLDALDFNYGYHGNLFDEELSVSKKKEKAKLLDNVIKAAKEIEEIEKGKIYEDAFEWRFEFPEVLDEEGNFVGFDVIIGNPPYGVKISKDETPHVSKNFNNPFSGEIETYIAFYYLINNLLSNNGFFGYITPDTWLTIKKAEGLRRNLKNNYKLIEVYDRYKPFVDAKDIRCHTIIAQKIQCSNYEFGVKVVNHEQDILKDFRLKNNVLNKDFSWNLYISPFENKIFNKMNQSSNLKDLVNIKYGLRTGNNKMYLNDNDINHTEMKIARGSNIERYFFNWKPEYLLTTDGLPTSYFNSDELKEKIIIQYVRTNSTDVKSWWIEACLIEEKNFVPLNSTSYLYSKKDISIDLKYMLAIISSKLLNYYYKAHYTDVNVKPLYLSKLPIPKIDKESQQPFVQLVDKIIEDKKLDKDTTELEARIDKMVYGLYKLREEEIAVVEGRDILVNSEIGYNNPKEEQS